MLTEIQPYRQECSPDSVPPRNKRWIFALRRADTSTIQMNEYTELVYHRIIRLIKKWHLNDGEVYCERDYKLDKKDGLFSMHAFMTATFYWRLDCSLLNAYQIEYAFDDCLFENIMRETLCKYPLNQHVVEVVLRPDFKTFYKTTLTIQSQDFLHKSTHK